MKEIVYLLLALFAIAMTMYHSDQSILSERK